MFVNPDQTAIRAFEKGDGSPTAIPSLMAVAMAGRIVAVDPQQRGVTLAFHPGDQFLQATGVIQGGAVCAMLDFAAAFALLRVLDEGQSTATASITVSFLRPVPKGEVIVRGFVEKNGRSLGYVRAVATSPGSNEILATAMTTLVVVGSASSK